MKNEEIIKEMRLNVYDENHKLIGQDYQRESGEWMHKWIDSKTGKFERGSWKGRCEGQGSENWYYKNVIN